MQLLIQPDDGVAPVLSAIDRAESSIDLCIFRLNYPALERALTAAISRGVVVRTLVAHTNGGRKDALRRLESRLLKIGATVARTDDNLLRYHAKMMVVDRRSLYVLGYNFTRKDVERSRSLGVATEEPDLVAEAIRLFEADFDRRVYAPSLTDFVVSPLNCRSSLLGLIEGAERRLLIYDPRLSDKLMQRAIEKKAASGVTVKIIGAAGRSIDRVQVQESVIERLHVRAIVQDDRRVFIGSQSLRRSALDRRGEIGVIVADPTIVRGAVATFERDWARLAREPFGSRSTAAAKAGR
jgi:phosphatidylserine/phosphatidylglycerophosphate/cardiolipin synthase-like enzyme